MRQIKTLLAAAVLLILAACGSNNTFPEPTITSVTPTEVTFGTELTITGSNYYAVTGAANTRIEVCGVTLNGTIVEPLTRSILLPPGSTITAQVGTTITSSLPEQGITAGRSDVRVTRPDGTSATLENAVTCVIPSEEPDPEPEPEPEPEPTPVTAVLTVSTTTAVAPATITFNAEDSTGEGELAYAWDFGTEGATATGAEVTHQYLQAGTFTVTLTITDETGAAAKATQEVVIHPALQAVIQHSEITSYAPITIDFDATNSTGIAPLTYAWDFGDETGTSTTPEASYEYEEAGTFTVTLTVTDANGDTDTAEAKLPIPASTPVNAVITADPIIGTAPLTVSFSALNSTGEGELEYAWHFGVADATSEEAEPAFTFTVGETYEVTLTVTDETGATDTATQDINVIDAPPVITSFTGPETVLVNEVITLNWAVAYDGSDDLTCIITPHEGAAPVDVSADCAAGSTAFTHGTAGPVLITLTVSDQSGNTVTETLTVQVNNALAPEITLFELTSPTVIGDNVTVSWKLNNPQGDPLTCSFHSGIEGAPVVEVSDCADRNGLFSGYPTAGEYTATLTVKDEHNNEVTATQIVHVDLPVAPSIESFAVQSPVKLRYRNEVTWEVNNPHGGPLTCTFTSGEGNAPQVLTNCDDGTYSYEYANVGTYTATLTVQDEHNDAVTETATVQIDFPHPPTVTEFTTTATNDNPIRTGEEVTFDWVIADHADELPHLTCELHFGDGTSESVTCADQQATHTYATPNNYAVSLLVTNQHGVTIPANLTAYIKVIPPAPVIERWHAFLEYDDPNGEEVTVAFDVRGRDATGPVTCSIDFGDNTSPRELGDDCVDNNRHTIRYSNYEIGETYDATLTITDTHGNHVTETIEVNVTNPTPPVIHTFETNPEPPIVIVDDYVMFTWAAEADSRVNSSLVSCTLTLTLGESTLPSCEGGSLLIQETELGEFTYTFTITDSYNPPVTREHTFTVLPAPPATHGFEGTPNPVEVNKPVTFSYAGYSYYSISAPLMCSVNPGDDTGITTATSCTSYSHQHTYTTPGTYTATLIVTDDADRETEFTTSVEVTESSAIDLTINTNGLPSGAEPTIYVFRSSPYFQEIINGAGTVTVPGPGTYTIQAPSGTNHTVSVPYGGDTLTYNVNWNRIELDFTVEAGTDRTVDLNFMIAPSSLQVRTQDLPDDYNITDVNARLQRLTEPNGDSWEDISTISTTNRTSITPGIYRVLVDDVEREVCAGSSCFTETYIAQDPVPTAHSSGALYDLITRTYDLQTASLTTTVTASGVTVDLPADSQLVKVPDFTVIPAPWGPLIPGHYILQPARVPSYLTMTSPPEETNYAPENGLIDIFYKADSQLVHLSSGETRNMNVDYEVADGLISVNILPPHGSNETVMGNIRIRAYPNGEEWHTFTTMGQHLFETPPGVYEVRVEDVPADPDAGHNGYTRNSYPTHPYFVVQSYGIDGGGNQLFLNYQYSPVNP